MAKKSDKTVNMAGDAVQQEMAAENGSSEQAAPAKKSSSKKSKKDKTAASTSENVTSNMDEDIPVPQLNEDGSIATTGQAPASATTADTATTEKSKKRKRKEGEAATGGPEGTTSAEAAAAPKEKTKKSKKSKDANAIDDTSASARAVDTVPQPAGIPQEVLAAVMAAPVPALDASTADDALKKKEKKKKSKKDKSGTAAEDGGNDNTEVQVDTVNRVASTSSAPANAVTESTQVVNSVETGQDENGKKKRKKKDKEVSDETAGGGDETTDKSKKKKKKDKEASTTNASAPSASEPSSTLNISANPAGNTTAGRDRQSTSPLPELRLPPFPPPPPASTSLPAPASTSISASVPADYENIDPSLRPTSRTPAPSSITPGGAGMPIARSTSMTGSTSIQPRDPSMPPPGTATSAPILPTMPTPASAGNGDAAPKKRGRPKKVVPDAVPASAPGTNANANAATHLVPAASSAGPAGRGISASAVPPSGRAPGSSVSPIMPTSNLPATSASTSAIAPSSTAPVPSAAAAAASSSSNTPAVPSTSRLPSSTNIFPGVNPNTLARAAMNPDFVPATLPEGTTPLQPSENKETHQELLASRWLNTKEMADLIEKEGLKVRTGKFSKAEDAALKLCIENYRQQQGLTQEQIDGIIFAKGRNTRADYGDFWTIVTRAVPDRALMSVYHHTKRIMQTDARKGPWSAEEDAKLKSAYKQFGPSWIKVSAVVGRWENDCRDRWRAYVGPNEKIQKGKWSKEEEDKLRETIRQVKIDIAKWKKENANGAPIEDEPAGGSDMFWSRVATKMGTRSRHQCRIKWNDHMRNKLLTADGKPVRWAKRDTFILIMKLHSLQLTDEDEIAWKLLPDSHWNWWSPHVLHKRWFTMKQRAKKQLENENASYSDIINWLKKEQDRIPRKEVKAFMAKKPGEVDGADEDGDGEDDDGEEEEGTQANAGTSAAAGVTTNGTAAVTQRSANGPSELRKKKAQDQSQFRTSEFVNSSDEED